MGGVVRFGNEVGGLPCRFHLLKGRGTIDDAEVCGAWVGWSGNGSVYESNRSVGEELSLHLEAVHARAVDTDAEEFFLISREDAFGYHDGSFVGFFGKRERPAGIGDPENGYGDREL